MQNITDACYELLGVPAAEQPADHYRLLGLTRLEANRQVIQNAADRQMAFVRQLAGGPYSEVSQELLNQLAEARLCLLNPIRKEEYDTRLTGGGVRDEPATTDRLPTSITSEFPVLGDGSSPSVVGEATLTDTGRSHFESINTVELSNLLGQRAHDKIDSTTMATFSEPTNPLDSADAKSRLWVVGAGSSCDVILTSKFVSRRHCQFSRQGEFFVVQDLDSLNGTFVNGERIRRPTRVAANDEITLGKSTKFPWNKILRGSNTDRVVRRVSIGRDESNDVVIPDVSVSQHHAEVQYLGNCAKLTDLGSLNGTYLNGSRRRITSVVIPNDGEVRFGKFQIPSALLLQY